MKKPFLLVFLFFIVCQSFSTNIPLETVDWKGIRATTDNNGKVIRFLYCTGASYLGDKDCLPQLNLQYPLGSPDVLLAAALVEPVFQVLTEEEASVISKETVLPSEILPACELGIIQKHPYAMISFVPLRRNPVSGLPEKLISYKIQLIEAPKPGPAMSATDVTYDTTSVLAEGNWVKMAINQNGIYKITYSELQSMGFDLSNTDPRNFRIYGNGSSPLAEANAAIRYDDLRENNIQVVGEEDGVFDPADYILFYGMGPVQWVYSAAKSRFVHKVNYYTDYSYYFITADHGSGRRIPLNSTSVLLPNRFVAAFNDFSYHDIDQYNLIKSGKTWYGEKFDLKLSYDLPALNFPNILGDSVLTMEVDVAARSESTSRFKVYVDNGEAANISVQPISASAFNAAYAMSANAVKKFYVDKPTFTLKVNYLPSTSNSIGWLNYIEFNVMRELKMVGSQMAFRNISSFGPGKITEFTLSAAPLNTHIWDLSDPTRAREQMTTSLNGSLQFIVTTDTLREYLAFDGSSFLSIASSEKIENQNLHGLAAYDMLIVHAPEFKADAERLALIHRGRGLSVLLETPARIYNEFSSGCQDITAIRDFARMLYDRPEPGKELKYLLLFGDASYDYKNRFPNNTNFIPTYQSLNSLLPTESYATDDYFGLLDANEGSNCAGNLDLGVGRLPVKTAQEAADAVNKIERYLGLSGSPGSGSGFANNVPRLGDWRNSICFIADDQDNNMHLDQAETMTALVNASNPEYNLDKIYFDSYPQVSTPGGNRFPDVNQAINKRISKGALIVNYTGHGGETGWAHERVLEISDINNWENTQAMPVFVTATCEFSRFDDPERSSGGEYAFLNPNGGGISLFTTTRLSFAATNFGLNMNFYNYVFDKVNGEYPNMGDVIRKSKTPANPQILNFVLLGDPALGIVYPYYRVETTTINGKDVGIDPDTIKAFSYVTVAGIVKDDNGAKITDFNGTIYPTIFDKPVEITTLANDDDSQASTFELQKNVIYRGKTSVVNGDFSFSFFVPRDIAYKFGRGKISYYAENGLTDANGYYDNFIIGGSEDDIETDDKGPEIQLFMNDSSFVSGGITDENPILLAYVRDEHGINTVGNGIGHDIVAVLDGQTEKSVVLNDFYEAQLNSYQKGVVRYPFSNLSEGLHSISLKVWDIYNNSSLATTEFVVVKSGDISVENLMNYPNPFNAGTNFMFNHNQAGGQLDVVISVFSLTGEEVKTIRTKVIPEGYQVGPIRWSGYSDQGDRISKGIYIYRLTLTNEAGKSVQKSAKLVVLN